MNTKNNNNNKKKKYLFVDIDGCLTSIEDENHYMCRNVEKYGVCERTLNLIRRIASETGCGIVISSNWRRFPDDGHFTFEEMSCPNPLPKLKTDLGELYCGDLPHDRHITKSEALELWFEDGGIRKSDIEFAIIDDDIGEGFASNSNFIRHFFFCDYRYGLTDGIAEDIIEFLNRND